MKRSAMKQIKQLLRSLMVAFMLVPATVALAQSGDYRAGTHYALISPPAPVRDSQRIEVVEVFWYGCPGCYSIEPVLNRWLKGKPADVDFWRSPAIWNPLTRIHARLYYTIMALDEEEAFHPKVFHAMHVQNQRLNSKRSIGTFFKRNGVEEADFERHFDSFAVSTRMRAASRNAERWDSNSTPEIIVAGKYRTNTRMAGGPQAMFKVVDHLIQLERRDLAQRAR